MSENTDLRGSSGTNPSMFRANNLTPEEQALLRRLRHESSWRRGYPLAVICGGFAAFLTRQRKMSTAAQIAIPTISLVIGNMVGKLSYVPTIVKQIKEKLPEDSLLRQQVELQMQRSKNISSLPAESIENNDSGIQFSQGSEYDVKNFEQETNKNDQKMNRYITYEELRQRNRTEAVKNPSPSQQTAFPVFQSEPAVETASVSRDETVATKSEEMDVPKKIVRYNKYGDPIAD